MADETDKTTPAVTATDKPVVEAPHPVRDKLMEFGLDSFTDKVLALGIDSVEDMSQLVETDLTGLGAPVIKVRKFLGSLKPVVTPEAAATVAAMNVEALLPTVPTDESWLQSLRSGGVLKIEQSTVIGAIRAALASRFGLYDLPKRLLGEMDAFVDATEEQVGEEYWALRQMLTEQTYGDLFRAIPGMRGDFVTQKRKGELLERINGNLWPAVINFNEALIGWQTAWTQNASSPGMLVTLIAAATSGGALGMAPGVMQPPDCGVLRDAALAVNDSINRTFRGTGVQTSAALAFDANRVKNMLDNPRLPMMCGMATRDLLIKKLGVSIPATYPRMETNLVRFILGIMNAEKVPGGKDEQQYFGAMFMLGQQIPWGDLHGGTSGGGGGSFTLSDSNVPRPAGIGEGRSRREKVAIPSSNNPFPTAHAKY